MFMRISQSLNPHIRTRLWALAFCCTDHIKSAIPICHENTSYCREVLRKDPFVHKNTWHKCAQQTPVLYSFKCEFVLNPTVLTLCCWNSSGPGCSSWTRWKDWTRRLACSSRRCRAHIHNHCYTTKNIHTVPDQYQHVKRDLLSCSVFPIYILSPFIAGDQGPVWHRDASLLSID